MSKRPPGDTVFSIEHLRESIFADHYKATLLDIPQPEELPDEVNLLTAEDQNKYLSQLEPFLSFHGYKTTSWGDFLELNAAEVEDRLLRLRASVEDRGKEPDIKKQHAALGAKLDTTLETPLRMLPYVRDSLYAFDFGLFERTMVDTVHRPSEPDQIFAVYFMPRDSPAGMRFRFFAEELERGNRLQGILPLEDVILYGQTSLLVIAHFQMEESNGPVNIHKALERLACAFEALASAHSRGITINAWPRRDFLRHETSFICSYAFSSNDETVADWAVPGVGSVSQDKAYAPIAGRRFPRRIVARFPPAPAEGDPPFAFYSEHDRPRPWTQSEAAEYPFTPGPKLFLWNFFWSSTDDRCDRACPTGERDLFDWEDTILEQAADPTFCYGLFHQKRWIFNAPNRECSPEQAALYEDDVLWWELAEPLPFDRFKRDVFELASRLSRSADWYNHHAETPYEQFEDEMGSQQYERVFATPLDDMGEDGPDSEGMFAIADSFGGNVAPDQLRRLFLRLLDPDPSMRPTAQQAAQELREIEIRESPRIVNVYKRWAAFRPPQPPLLPFSDEANERYMRAITAERPPFRLWAEHAVYKVRKRQGRSGAMDRLLESDSSL